MFKKIEVDPLEGSIWKGMLIFALPIFRIYFLGVPFTVVTAFLPAMMQAKGNSFTPFFFQILASLLNIALNLFFVISLDLNIVGVASATVISQAALLLAVVIYLTGQTDELKLDMRKLTLFGGTREIFSIGIPSSVEGAVMNLSSVIISSVINKFDTNVIAGNTVATTVEGLMVISFTGFAGASTVFISQNHGARNAARIMKTYKLTITSVFIIAETLGVLLYIFSPGLLRLFTSEQPIIDSARVRMFYMCLFFGLCGIMNVISGCERGLGDARTPLLISMICSVVFRLTWIFTYAAWKGTIQSVYVSYPICWGLCVVLNMIAFRAIFRKRCDYGDRVTE